MEQTKQKEREAYEPPVVTDIAPFAVAMGNDSGTGDEGDISGGFD